MTKQIPVGSIYYAIVDDEDYESLSQYHWEIAKRNNKIYATRSKRKTPIGETRYMHKLITGFKQTDHKNGNGLDNRRENLRNATQLQNNWNASKSTRPGLTSKFKGVRFDRRENRTKRWTAQIKIAEKCCWLGAFATEVEAAEAYDQAARKHYGEFGRFNFPMEGEQSC